MKQGSTINDWPFNLIRTAERRTEKARALADAAKEQRDRWETESRHQYDKAQAARALADELGKALRTYQDYCESDLRAYGSQGHVDDARTALAKWEASRDTT